LKRPEQLFAVPGTEGQVWGLSVIDQKLYCAHDRGLLSIEGDDSDASLIFDAAGTWSVKPLKSGSLLLGTYAGLYELRLDTSPEIKKWEGFDISSREFHLLNENQVIVHHGYKGVFIVERNNPGEYERIFENASSSGSMAEMGEDLYFATAERVFVLDKSANQFLVNQNLTDLIRSKLDRIDRLLSTESSLWVFGSSGMMHIEKMALDNYLSNYLALGRNQRRPMLGFDNIAKAQNGYVTGGAGQYILIKDEVINLPNRNLNYHRIQLLNDEEQRLLPITGDQQLEIPSDIDALRIETYVPLHQPFSNTEYSFRTSSLNDEWTPWRDDAAFIIKPIPKGSHKIEIRSRINGEIQKETLLLDIFGRRPWYRSILAIILYILTAIGLIVISIIWINKRNKTQQRRLRIENERKLSLEKLENKAKLAELENQRLNQEVDSNNRELQLKTTNILNKNKVLTSLKTEAEHLPNSPVREKILDILNEQINSKKDWQNLQDAFKHADQRFFMKLKEEHPNLTSKDLRLCTYLRMNLTSKEIAPLFAISPKSVEVKRYRLRKKLGISSETSLNDYLAQL
jgi:DNA-binding CsgD family transcriptional regulator